MECSWKNHSIRITGNWVARYLFLAPQYELWLDDQRIDAQGGPRLHPKLEAIVELEDDTSEDDPSSEEIPRYHIEANILSIAGLRPLCELTIDGEPVSSERIKVENTLNPFLVIFILITTSWMLYIGPDVLRSYIQ